MPVKFANRWLLLAGAVVCLAAGVRADEEQDLIAVLQSAAGVPEKCAACQKLRAAGSVRAVPALAALLGEERTGHAARFALEGMPFPEAGAALRQACQNASGLVQAGLVDSLGWRRDPAAVPLLVPLLAGDDPTVAAAAATALGRIGGPPAASALTAARKSARKEWQGAVCNGLLNCAEQLLAAGNGPGAAALYRDLEAPDVPAPIRLAAWRGLVLADADTRLARLQPALTNSAALEHATALKTVRELRNRQVVTACLAAMPAMPADAQLAVLDAALMEPAEARGALRAALASQHAPVRAAALQALADLGDASFVPALCRAAADGEPAERVAARDSLTRLTGDPVRSALLQHLGATAPAERVEVLRALGDRGETAAAALLVENAIAGAGPVRLAALEALRKLAVADTVAPLLDLAAKSTSDEDREPVLRAIYAGCQAHRDQARMADQVVEAIGRFPVAQRRQVLPLLAELGTVNALAAAMAAMQDPDADLAREALRVLAQWPNAAPANPLLALVRSTTNSVRQTLALRACISVVAHDPDPAWRLGILQQALSLAQRPEERRQALGQIGRVPTPDALQVVLPHLEDASLVNEAALAAIDIVEKLAPGNPALADEVAGKVLARCQAAEIVKRAVALRPRPASAAGFIRNWVVAGPYSQEGVAGAVAVFNIPFDPEKTGAAVAWKPVPRADHINLSALFPGRDNCAAYLRTQIISPREAGASLLLGSDDGVKAWWNGEVVHSNNVDRGEVADQDVAPIRLRQGTNQLLLKISQGGGGWSACARIVGANGAPIPDLLCAPAPGAAPAAAAPAPPPPPAPKASVLPKRDAFLKKVLSDQFYAEGAACADFNRDGKLDVVAGPFWFEGPEFQIRHEYRPAKAFDPKGYSDNFLTYTGDFSGDGWPDVLCVPFPGKEGYWYENPAGKGGPWVQHLAYAKIGNESPMWGDVTGDGRPELIFCNDGFLGYAGPDPARPDQPWAFHAVSQRDQRYHQFTHGVGYGDLNGDGRADLLEAAGWWEQPAAPTPGQPWLFHPFRFATDGAQMLVADVDGDGLADVITAWHCHQYGLVWWQQVKSPGGPADWRQHVILSPKPDLGTSDFRVSQMHALEWVDMNGDGLKDILTGKRFWAHGPAGDKEPDAPAVVFWLELRRDRPGEATFVPHLVDDDSGVGTQVTAVDLNGDQRPDVVVGNKKGIFVHLSQPDRK